jgi:hypothetical protein
MEIIVEDMRQEWKAALVVHLIERIHNTRNNVDLMGINYPREHNPDAFKVHPASIPANLCKGRARLLSAQ